MGLGKLEGHRRLNIDEVHGRRSGRCGDWGNSGCSRCSLRLCGCLSQLRLAQFFIDHNDLLLGQCIGAHRLGIALR